MADRDVVPAGGAQHLTREVGDILRGNPNGAQPGIDFRGLQIDGLNVMQRSDVLLKTRINCGRFLRPGQFLTDIAG